jgi:hypothetical protein
VEKADAEADEDDAGDLERGKGLTEESPGDELEDGESASIAEGVGDVGVQDPEGEGEGDRAEDTDEVAANKMEKGFASGRFGGPFEFDAGEDGAGDEEEDVETDLSPFHWGSMREGGADVVSEELIMQMLFGGELS